MKEPRNAGLCTLTRTNPLDTNQMGGNRLESLGRSSWGTGKRPAMRFAPIARPRLYKIAHSARFSAKRIAPATPRTKPGF